MSQRPRQTCRASFLPFPPFCQDPSPGPSWVRALVWRWTAEDVSISFSYLSAASPPASDLFPSRTSTHRSSCQSVCTWDDTVSCRSSFMPVRSATLSGFCLNFPSNKKLTPPQRSHNPRAERLKKVF